MSTEVMAWHFTGTTLRDGQPIPDVGVKLKHKGRLVPCKSGLHASVDPFDALKFAPGALLHRVRCSGRIIEHGGDKIVCRERTIVASIDATSLLRRFACDQAIEALRITSTTPPQIVADYLRTTDESLRAAARDAAWTAAWTAARDAARAAARDAAWTAARDAARAAARDAAWAAARAAARDAAWTAAWAAARDAAWSAAWAAAWTAARAAARDAAWAAAWTAARDAARDAAWTAARDAAWDAAWAAARKDFAARVHAAFGMELEA